MALGELPLSRTALLPVNREPNQCILAPVWYRGGMQRNTSSWVGLVVDGLHPGGLEQGLVLEEDGLGEAGGAGGVVDGRVILILDEHLRGLHWSSWRWRVW